MMGLFPVLLGGLWYAGEAQTAFEVKLTPSGALAEVNFGGESVARRVGVMVVKPEWRGSWHSQVTDESDERIVLEGGRYEYDREVAIEGGKLRIEGQVETVADGLRLTYRITSNVNLDCQGIFMTAAVPVAAVAGVGKWYAFTGSALKASTFPETLPTPYHLYSGPTQWIAWVLPSGNGVRFELADSAFAGASLQDDRQFNMDEFELQLPVRGTTKLEAGQGVTFQLLMRPFTVDQAVQELAAFEALEEAQKVTFESRKTLQVPSRLPAFQTRSGEQTAKQYDTLEWDLGVEGTWDNPFDERDVEVVATFTTPSGRQLEVAGFWYVPYERQVVNNQERLMKSGEPAWKLRFTPSEAGEYEWRLRVRDRSGEKESEPARFFVQPQQVRGFVRRSNDTPYYLEYDNGEPYFAIGEDVCWGGARQTLDYDEWFPALGAAGGNFARIWLVRWNMGLEWTPTDPSVRGRFYGPGLYSMDNAARLDYVLDLAEKHGIRCMLALGYHGELMETGGYFGEQCWQFSPYNQANGGPCAKPAEFWTNPEAKRLYKQKLRYYVARYAHNTHIQSWEFWNEVVAPVEWVAEMAAYLKSIDPYKHLVTTTYGYPEVWNLADIDFTQTHTYGTGEGRRDCSAEIARLCREHTEAFNKPHLVGEFGIDWQKSDRDHDPQGHGVNLHNGLWSSMASRGMGGAMIWYWDNYVHMLNLYHEFTALAEFAKDIPWNKLQFRIAEIGVPTVETEAGAPWRDLSIQPPMGWGRATGTEFTIEPDGRITGDGAFSSFLYSPAKPNERQPLSFRVTCPQGGQMVVHVDTVSGRAVLQVRIDGQVAWEKEFVAGPEGEGEYTSTKWYEEWKVWQSTFDRDYTVEIPPGEHIISLDNLEGDWINIGSYTFRGCVDPKYASNLAVRGIQTDELAILWLQNTEHNWYNATHGIEIPPTRPATFELFGLKDGQYIVQWYDTSSGRRTREESITCEGGRIAIRTAEIASDIACKVRRAAR